VIFTINLADQRYVFERGGDGMMFIQLFMCANVYDVALGLWLFGHPWCGYWCIRPWMLFQMYTTEWHV